VRDSNGRTILHQELVSACTNKGIVQSQLGNTGYFEKERRTHDMRVKVIAESHVDGLVYLRPEWRRDFWDRVRPDTSLER
jgi:hypothetical protein